MKIIASALIASSLAFPTLPATNVILVTRDSGSVTGNGVSGYFSDTFPDNFTYGGNEDIQTGATRDVAALDHNGMGEAEAWNAITTPIVSFQPLLSRSNRFASVSNTGGSSELQKPEIQSSQKPKTRHANHLPNSPKVTTDHSFLSLSRDYRVDRTDGVRSRGAVASA